MLSCVFVLLFLHPWCQSVRSKKHPGLTPQRSLGSEASLAPHSFLKKHFCCTRDLSSHVAWLLSDRKGNRQVSSSLLQAVSLLWGVSRTQFPCHLKLGRGKSVRGVKFALIYPRHTHICSRIFIPMRLYSTVIYCQISS